MSTRQTHLILSLLCTLLLSPALQATPASDQLLEQYRQLGAGPFSATTGEQLWHSQHTTDDAKQRGCGSCHGENLRAAGEHQRTHKAIEPLAPSVNSQRFTDAKKIEKWFLRNCKWTFGRVCSAQEKGDLLSFLITQ